MFQKRKIYIFIVFIIILNSVFLFPEKTENKKKKTLKRAIVECASGMAFSQANYWIKYSNWIEDWQYKLTWADQKKRIFLLDGQKFDSNPFQTNWTHAFSGAMYYNVARTNGLNLFESSVFTTLTSLYWEFIVEWREVISVNDNIFTSFGGIGIGESFFQLGSYFNGKTGIVNNIAGIISNPVMAINRWLDREKNIRYSVPDKRDMSFFIGSFFLMEDRSEPSKDRNMFLGFNSSLTYLPKITNKGILKKDLKDTVISEFYFELEFKDRSIDEISGYTRNVYFAKYKHNIHDFSENYIKGYSFLYGLSSGFEFFKEKSISEYDSTLLYKYIDESIYVETPTEFTDKLAIIKIIGPYTEFSYYFGKSKIQFMNTLSLDFGLINAFALNKYSETEDISYTKSTLYNYGYYYGLGFTFDSRLSFSYGRFKTNFEYKYQNYNSIEGIDRYQDKIRNDFNITDSVSTFKFDTGYRMKILPIGIKLIYEKRDRKGCIKHVINSLKETKVYVRLDLLL